MIMVSFCWKMNFPHDEIKTNHLKCNACRILTHILNSYSLSILITVLWNHGIYDIKWKLKVALFVNRPMAFKCMTLKYRHTNSMHTMKRLVAPLNGSAIFPSALLNKTDVLMTKITVYCKEWQLKMCVIKYSCITFQIKKKTDYTFLELYQNVSDGTLTMFWLGVV